MSLVNKFHHRLRQPLAASPSSIHYDSLRVLEWDKLCDLVASFATTSAGRGRQSSSRPPYETSERNQCGRRNAQARRCYLIEILAGGRTPISLIKSSIIQYLFGFMSLAKEYFEKDADNDEVGGHYNFGCHVSQRYWCKRDVKLACKYFIVVANNGQPKAFYQLAKMFHTGVGLKKSIPIIRLHK
ncbi:hypothetical protein K1719_019238 [Acacia pycnantha]|nr:hypothetical protein K1719_019238 [Acacia pycnantha]